MKRFLLSCIMVLPMLGIMANPQSVTTVTITLVVCGEEVAQVAWPGGQAFSYDQIMSYVSEDALTMPNFQYPFLGWSRSDTVYDPVMDGDPISTAVTLYAAYNALDGYRPEPIYKWVARPVSSFDDLLSITNNAGLNLYVLAYEENGILYFPERAQYVSGTSDATGLEAHILSGRISANELNLSVASDGTVTGLDYQSVASFNLMPFYDENSYPYPTVDGDTVYAPSAWQIQDFNEKQLYIPLFLDENSGRYYIGYTQQEEYSDMALWNINMSGSTPYISYGGWGDMMLHMFTASDYAPYFYAADPQTSGTDSVNMRLYYLTAVEEEPDTTQSADEILPVFDYNTVSMTLSIAEMEKGGLDIDEEWLTQKMKEDPHFAYVPGFITLEPESDYYDSVYVGDTTMSYPTEMKMAVLVLEGYTVPFMIHAEGGDRFGPVWHSSDPAFDGLRDNPLYLTPTQDMTLSYTVEYTPAVIVDTTGHAPEDIVNINLRLYGEKIYSFRFIKGTTLDIMMLNEMFINAWYEAAQTGSHVFDFIENGMKIYGMPFGAWTRNADGTSPVDESGFVVTGETDLYAAFEVPGSGNSEITWTATPVTSAEHLMRLFNEGKGSRFILGARNSNGSVVFPSQPNVMYENYPSGEQPYYGDTIGSEQEDPYQQETMEMHYLNNQIPAGYLGTDVAPVFNADGSISGLSDYAISSEVASFLVIPYFSGDGSDGQPNVGFQFKDPDTWFSYMPTIKEENTGRYYVGFTNMDVNEDDVTWYLMSDSTGDVLIYHGVSGMTLGYSDDIQPYFYAYIPADSSSVALPSGVTLYALSEVVIPHESRFVTDFHTVELTMPLDQMDKIEDFTLYEPYLEKMMEDDPMYAEFPGFYAREDYADSVDVEAVGKYIFDIFPGYCLPFYVVLKDTVNNRPTWYSSYKDYNGVHDNPIFVYAPEDLTLRLAIEDYKPVIIIAGDTIQVNDSLPTIVNLTEDGSVKLDVENKTIVLDSAAVTGTGIVADLVDFVLQVDNNSTIAVDEDYGIKFDGEYISLVTEDSVMLTVQAPQPLVGNGFNDLFISGNFIFSSVEFRLVAGQAYAHRRNIPRMPSDATPIARPAVSGFANVAMAEGIEVREVYYTDENGNSVKGDPSRAVYHAAESAYGEIDVDTQSFTPATTLVFADSNFYTDYIDGKIDLGTCLPIVNGEESDIDAGYYDVLGRRINGSQQGIYIFGGKVYLK